MDVTYGDWFQSKVLAEPPPVPMIDRVRALQVEVSKLPQFEPETHSYFHGGMYCREVRTLAGMLVVGKVHKKEHFYLVASGTVQVTVDDCVREITGPCLILSAPGTKRAIYSATDSVWMTFHVTDAKTVNDAECDLVEADPTSMFDAYNRASRLVEGITS